MKTTLTPAEKSTKERFGRSRLIDQFKQIRQTSKAIVEPLEPEDFAIQVMTQTSPTKWHLAHVSWFFEIFVLEKIHENYQSPHPQYAFIFNSYYLQTGQPFNRSRRGWLSRPTVAEVFEYRDYVNQEILHFLENASEKELQKWGPVIEIGNNHEQQHQELMLTDLKYMFGQNPLFPVYRECEQPSGAPPAQPQWIPFEEGIYEIGNKGDEFTYDNEHPRHRCFLEPFALADRLVTNGEYLEFMQDDGYNRSELWLDDGWATVNKEGWQAPLYWIQKEEQWHYYTLGGLREVDLREPVTHISYYEADAYARWREARLPTEAEWETAAGNVSYEGNFVESQQFHPRPLQSHSDGLQQLYGDVWEWTKSAYEAYPGYKPLEGALGEYNGKFMASQYVLRGGSCATSQSHIRKTYRNFFYPDARWQFSGLRLAKTV